MLVIHSPIPDIVGRKCVQLIGQQFWLSGELDSDLISIFMSLNDGSWHKIFFDSGVLFWELKPPMHDTQITDKFHYPCIDLFSRLPLQDCKIEDVITIDLAGKAELRLLFSNGHVLVLRDNTKGMEIACEVYPNT